MPLNKIVLPALGEGITDATIIRWLVDEGEIVTIDQPIVEIATDKVDSEVYSPYDGILKKIVALPGEVPRVGDIIAYIQVDNLTSSEPIVEPEIPEKLIKVTSDTEKISFSRENQSETTEVLTGTTIEMPFIPPFIRSAIREFNIDIDDFIRFTKKKKGDIVNKKDLDRYIENRTQKGINKTISKPHDITAEESLPILEKPLPVNGQYEADVEKVPLPRIRKKIAENMLLSSKTIPHVTSFIEVDVTHMIEWREQNKEEFYRKYNTRLTLTHLFVEAIVAAIKAYPQINVSLDGDTLIIKKSIHIGMATVLPDGNLIVPVIKNADKLNLSGIAYAVNDLSDRARNYNLKPNEAIGSTFTFTNIGIFGSLTGTPLINVPEAAILGIGAATKKPWAISTPQGYALGIRDIVMLSLAYDHRIIDGSLGGLFLKFLKDTLENFDKNRTL